MISWIYTSMKSPNMRGRVRETPGPRTDSVTARDRSTAPSTLLLTVAEVELELRLGRTRVYQLLRSGEIPSVRVSARAIRVTREDLLRWVDSKYQPPAPPAP